MKSLIDYLNEEEAAAVSATPANTMGLGNPAFPDPSNGILGSEGVPSAKPKRKKKKKAERTDESYKFPLDMLMKELLHTIVEFRIKIEDEDGEFIVKDFRGNVVGNLGSVLSKRRLAEMIVYK